MLDYNTEKHNIIEVEESDVDNITKSLESIINIMKGWKK